MYKRGLTIIPHPATIEQSPFEGSVKNDLRI